LVVSKKSTRGWIGVLFWLLRRRVPPGQRSERAAIVADRRISVAHLQPLIRVRIVE